MLDLGVSLGAGDLTPDALQPSVDLVPRAPFHAFQSNFQLLSVPTIDWFDDAAWTACVHDVGVATAAVRDAELRGVFFDVTSGGPRRRKEGAMRRSAPLSTALRRRSLTVLLPPEASARLRHGARALVRRRAVLRHYSRQTALPTGSCVRNWLKLQHIAPP
jgi:hypothetical protein